MKRRSLWALLAGIALVAAGVLRGGSVAGAEQAPLRVGFSQMEMTNPWRIAETISIRQSAEARGIDLTILDADSDAKQQVLDCLKLIEAPVDYLILAPRLSYGYEEVFDAAAKAGIPVILVDRETSGKAGIDYASCITADFEWEGRTCAKILAEASKGKPCNVIELTGTPGSSVARSRSAGFMEELAKHPNMSIALSASGDFVRTTAQETMESILQNNEVDFQAIFAHDDDTGIGAIQALKKAGLVPGKDVLVVSVAGQKDALKAIIAGELLASVECNPRLGEYAFGVIDAIEKGEDYQERIIYNGRVYDSTNAEENYERAF